MSPYRLPQVPVVASMGLALAALLTGCHGDSTTSAQFAESNTVPAPGLVKLVDRGHSGSSLVVGVVLFGPEPTLDLSTFRFGIRIEDAAAVRFVPQSRYAQTALVAGAGQSIAIEVDGVSDPSLVQVTVEKVGGGAGNGFNSPSATVIELPFEVQGAGRSTLTLVGLGANPPQALDSAAAPIAAVRFDAAGATVLGVTSGGGGY